MVVEVVVMDLEVIQEEQEILHQLALHKEIQVEMLMVQLVLMQEVEVEVLLLQEVLHLERLLFKRDQVEMVHL